VYVLKMNIYQYYPKPAEKPNDFKPNAFAQNNNLLTKTPDNNRAAYITIRIVLGSKKAHSSVFVIKNSVRS